MEERLDDAINVLRNHAESQLVLGQLPPNLNAPQMTTLGYAAPPPEPHLPDPVKVERATYNTSTFIKLYLFNTWLLIVFLWAQKNVKNHQIMIQNLVVQ